VIWFVGYRLPVLIVPISRLQFDKCITLFLSLNTRSCVYIAIHQHTCQWLSFLCCRTNLSLQDCILYCIFEIWTCRAAKRLPTNQITPYYTARAFIFYHIELFLQVTMQMLFWRSRIFFIVTTTDTMTTLSLINVLIWLY
jgi:hypothetical protein